MAGDRSAVEELLKEESKPLTDDDYAPFNSEGAKTGENRSPKGSVELQAMSDQALLAFLNDWEEVHRDSEKWWVDINFEGLGHAFQEVIMSDIGRFAAWGDRWKEVRRPFYFRSVYGAVQKLIQAKSIVDFAPWFALGEWIVMLRVSTSHPGNQRPAKMKIP